MVILISGEPDVPWPDVGPVLAAENLMIAAASLGLSTLWSTTFTKGLFRDAESLALKPKLIPEGFDVKQLSLSAILERIPESDPRERANETAVRKDAHYGKYNEDKKQRRVIGCFHDGQTIAIGGQAE